MTKSRESLAFPTMREELFAALEALSDRAYQENAWVRGVQPNGIEYDFGMVVDFLFDDTQLADDIDATVGFILYPEEVSCIRELVEAVDAVFEAVEPGDLDEEYVRHPLWERVVETAQSARRILEASR